MKIGIISDTHIPDKVKKIPEKVFQTFSNVDLIIHAGDLVDETIIDELGVIAKVEAVKGNMDKTDNPYPVKKTFNIEKMKVGLMHGYGPPFGLRKRIRKEFDDINIIVYGHSHVPYNDIENGILFFNPGSATCNIFDQHNSIGIIEINGKETKGQIIEL